jgi:integrase/recombinase XerD
MKTQPSTVLAHELRDFFSTHLPLVRGLSPKTVGSYRDTFVLLLRFLSKRHACAIVNLDLAHLGTEDLIAFLDDLERERGNCIATRNARLAAIHSFARFIATRLPEQVERCQGLLTIPTKRAPIRPVEHLEPDEIRAMIAAVDCRKPAGRRDLALLLTLFNTGARVQELLDIRLADLHLEGPCQVRLHGKGRKERVCPLWVETVEALQALLSQINGADPNPPIFRNCRGETLTRFGVRYLLCGYAERARTAAPRIAQKRIHPHTYRHSAAVYLLQSGVDIVTISHWLGHACIATTNRYAVSDLETKRKALERAGPIEKGNEAVASWRKDASILEWLEGL